MVLKEGMQVGGAGARADGEMRGPDRGIEDPFAWICHGSEGKGGGERGFQYPRGLITPGDYSQIRRH